MKKNFFIYEDSVEMYYQKINFEFLWFESSRILEVRSNLIRAKKNINNVRWLLVWIVRDEFGQP